MSIQRGAVYHPEQYCPICGHRFRGVASVHRCDARDLATLDAADRGRQPEPGVEHVFSFAARLVMGVKMHREAHDDP